MQIAITKENEKLVPMGSFEQAMKVASGMATKEPIQIWQNGVNVAEVENVNGIPIRTLNLPEGEWV